MLLNVGLFHVKQGRIMYLTNTEAKICGLAPRWESLWTTGSPGLATAIRGRKMVVYPTLFNRWAPSMARRANAALAIPPTDPSADHVQEIRGERVVLDERLAAIFGVTTTRFNEAFRRNAKRFPPGWAFQLTQDEFDHLISQFATSKGRGGRRKLPWAFTEHGVVMAASILRSERATSIMHMVVDVFVRARRVEVGVIQANRPATLMAGAFSQRVQRTIERVMDAMVDHNNQCTVRDEAEEVFQKSISYIKNKLDKSAFENQEVAARATALLSEAEANKAYAARTSAEAEAIALQTLVNRLRLVLEAEQAMARGEMEGFMSVLRELGKPATTLQLALEPPGHARRG